MKQINFSAGSRYEQVSEVCLLIREACLENGRFSNDQLNHIELAFSEAANNVIQHSYLDQPDRMIEVNLVLHDTRVEIQIIDTGEPMSSNLLDSTVAYKRDEIAEQENGDLPDVNKNPDTKSINSALLESGRGLKIIKSVMSEVQYTSIGGRNIMLMSLRI